MSSMNAKWSHYISINEMLKNMKFTLFHLNRDGDVMLR
jgi:hypothetical protein